ncbi:MAG: hypothetical protein M3N11_07110 [Actinomycetota bacterium]|nr:hypothetical protein [Actinomycetota bacterium]
MDQARLDSVLAPEWAADPAALSIDELRARRAEVQAVEVALSYQRRVAQGRLDIVAAERQRRATGGEPFDHERMVARLSEILSQRTRAPGVGRLPQLLAPEPAEAETPELDAIAGPGVLASLPGLSDGEVDQLMADLAEFEMRCSSLRRELHDRIDLLQAEVVRRYRSGEVSVESLLQ